MTTSETPIKKPRKRHVGLTLAQQRKVAKPYWDRLGRLLFDWNSLHETLSKIFAQAVDPENPQISLAVWHSTDSDFAQRKMLRLAIPHSTRLKEAQKKDILWILGQIDESIRHKRNDFVHAPLRFISNIFGDIKNSRLEVDPYSASPRAKSLQDKAIITTLDELAELTGMLAGYAFDITTSLTWPIFPWPDKPRSPQAHRKSRRKGSSRQKARKRA